MQLYVFKYYCSFKFYLFLVQVLNIKSIFYDETNGFISLLLTFTE